MRARSCGDGAEATGHIRMPSNQRTRSKPPDALSARSTDRRLGAGAPRTSTNELSHHCRARGRGDVITLSR